MRKSVSVLPSLVAAVILAACGGGGDGNNVPTGGGANTGNLAGSSSTSSGGSNGVSSTSASDSPVGNTQPPASGGDTADSTIYSAVKPSQGDTLVYNQTVTYPGNAQPFNALLTRYFKTLNPDGTSLFTLTSSSPAYFGTATVLDASGAQVNHTVHGGEFCTFSPSFTGTIGSTPGVERVAGTYSVGTTWSYTSVASCTESGSSYNVDVSNTGGVVARESVSVYGVRFNTVKEVYSVTAARQPSGSYNARKIDYTCWRDTVLGRVVQCNITSNIIPPNSTAMSVQYTATLGLQTYTLNGTSGSTAVPPLNGMLAGGWTFTFSGSTSGSCSLAVSLGGSSAGNDVSGSCTTSAGTFPVNGSVGANRQVTFGGSFAPGATTTFTGYLTNPLEGNGSWTDNAGGSGTWKSTHN